MTAFDARGGTRVGVLGGGPAATVDGRGRVTPARARWGVDWWVGADDRWHRAHDDVAVRQSLVDGMPVVQTAMRVAGGDAHARVYGARVGGDVVVWEIENASPVPFVAALVVDGAYEVELRGTTLVVDGRPALRAARAPSRHAVSSTGELAAIVAGGDARDGELAGSDAHGRLEAALLYPVAHRTVLRIELAATADGLPGPTGRALPDAATAARAWRAQLDRAMRVDLPEPAWNVAVDRARGAVLLAGQDDDPAPATVAALEDWGFDPEALGAWRRLGRRARRVARRRETNAGDDALRTVGDDDAAQFLVGLRAALVSEDRGAVVLLPGWPARWHGAPVDVRDAPTTRGPVSFSLRWHGDRPALLWDAPEGVRLRAPGLDSDWTSDAPSGEVLLAG